MQTVAVATLGCKINQFESAAMIESLGKKGYRVVPFTEKADIYIINSCTVTAKTDAESRRLIRRAARQNAEAKIVVTGCYAQVAKEELADIPGVSLIIGNAEKKGIDLLLDEPATDTRVFVSDIFREERNESLSLESFAEHTRAFLQIQNGCNEFCAYCIVPYARGKSRSVPFDDVLAGIRSFASRGYREVVLTGIHLGAYGLDLQPQRTLHDVLLAAEEQRLVRRLRLGSIEPQEISDDFIQLLARSAIICPHLHIPLQSGSDGVLSRMNRKYTSSFFRDLIGRITAASPDICLGADVIAGFPGETEEEFEESFSLIDSLPLAYLHVFPFSPRKGTPAAALPGRLTDRLLKERVHKLRALSEAKKEAYCRRFHGKELPVLFLSKGKNGRLLGLSRNYLQISVEGDESAVNREKTVRITGVNKGMASGECVERG